MKIKSIDVINKIIFSLKEKPQTFSQIANSNSIHWDSAKNYLNQLEEMNIVYKETINSKQYYTLHPNPKSQHDYKTYFNIPIQKDMKEKIESYFAIIKQEYIKTTNKQPTITQMYKILAQLNKEKQLNLPMCWYSYGLISPVIYNGDQNYEQKSFIPTDVKEKTTEIIKQYSQYTFTRELLIKQYEEFDNQLYLSRENFLSSLYKKESFQTIKNKYLEFIEQLNNYNISKQTKNYYNIYYTFLLHSKDVLKTDLEIQQNSIETFKKLFKFVALEEFEKSIQNHTSLNKEILHYIISKEYNSYKETIDEEITLFKELIEEKTNQTINITPNNFERGTKEELQDLEEQEKMLKSMNLD